MNTTTFFVAWGFAVIAAAMLVSYRRRRRRVALLRDKRGFGEQRRCVLDSLSTLHRNLAGLWERLEILEEYSSRYELTLLPTEREACLRTRACLEEAVNVAEMLVREHAWDEAGALVSYLLSPRANPGGSLYQALGTHLSFDIATLKDWDYSTNGALSELSTALKVAAAERKLPSPTSCPSRKPTIAVASELEEEFRSKARPPTSFRTWD